MGHEFCHSLLKPLGCSEPVINSLRVDGRNLVRRVVPDHKIGVQILFHPLWLLRAAIANWEGTALKKRPDLGSNPSRGTLFTYGPFAKSGLKRHAHNVIIPGFKSPMAHCGRNVLNSNYTVRVRGLLVMTVPRHGTEGGSIPSERTYPQCITAIYCGCPTISTYDVNNIVYSIGTKSTHVDSM